VADWLPFFFVSFTFTGTEKRKRKERERKVEDPEPGRSFRLLVSKKRKRKKEQEGLRGACAIRILKASIHRLDPQTRGGGKGKGKEGKGRSDLNEGEKLYNRRHERSNPLITIPCG